ncbi:winged helix-turn-helix transcriptional regulator [Natribaculum luteum]|uniref:Winged helix-turn-helix transcriptional regulator n=1 Tax=Natribaculum luteum TaxID=1586232 RepID=A0ABD5P2K4_9EURY|nr:winged helix-turn-helix transcriptional regulator [Natribaculum luteum]
MSDVRHQIRRRIRTDPGIHFNALARDLDLAAGQTQYHTRRLLRADEIVSEELYGRTHYYPTDYDPWDRRALALLRRETSRDVLVSLIERGPTSPSDVADELGIARSTLEWHLSHLVEQGLVEKRYDERNRVTLYLANPERTGKLLARVTPSVADRLVDRFARLVDNLLEDAHADASAQPE